MALFYYNRYSGENIDSQWIKHMQTTAYIDDIDDIVSYRAQEFKRIFENASEEHKSALKQVCGSLQNGFSEVNQHLKNINFNISELRGEINEMASMLDWNLSQMIEGQKITNQLLGKVTALLRIPDSQKQRVYYIEQGLKYLKNALIEGFESDFYEDAYESLKEAEKVERKDFILLNSIGKIYLYSKKYLNFKLAEEYFLKSAREASAENNSQGTTVSNHFTPTGYQSIIYSQDPFKAAIAEAYLYAARSCYLQKKFSEAADLARKAHDLVPEFLEAGFEEAKYLAANDQENEAVKILEVVINKDRFFSMKAWEDGDLRNKSSVLKLLNRLLGDATKKAFLKYEECVKIMKKNSCITGIISEIEYSILEKNFLSAMRAIDLLEANYNLSLVQYQNSPLNDLIIARISDIRNSPIELIKQENQNDKQLEDLKRLVRKRNITFYRNLFGVLAGVIGIFIGVNFKINLGILTPILFGVLGATLGYFIGESMEPKIEDQSSIKNI